MIFLVRMAERMPRKKCLTLKNMWTACAFGQSQVCLPASSGRNACMDTQKQRPLLGGKLTASSQERRATINNGGICHELLTPRAKAPLSKAATVTSQLQAGKSSFGSWQRKFSRSLALTSCCHGSAKLDGSHTPNLWKPSPRASGFLQEDCGSSHF